MEQDERIAGDHRAGEALTDPLLPDLARPTGGPRRRQRRTGVGAVSLRAEKLRPVGRRYRHARHQKAGELSANPRAHNPERYHAGAWMSRTWITIEETEHTSSILGALGELVGQRPSSPVC